MNMYKCFLDLGVWPAHAVVKVDDTGVGIDEGVAAGCWTVGVALSGNEAGLTPSELAAQSPDQRSEVCSFCRPERTRSPLHHRHSRRSAPRH
ncbi:hypothetical protein [Neorhizobium sp. P12A]|uniref:hypothetical protein n=1 Tax=Neorhizobium sp. P12A TaxID=2268027 RepID=UPI00165DFEC6|nr:hypothetical protein [Neorhizobium sp. P12A]